MPAQKERRQEKTIRFSRERRFLRFRVKLSCSIRKYLSQFGPPYGRLNMLANPALGYSALNIPEFARFVVTPGASFLTDIRWPPIRSAPGAFLLNVTGRLLFAQVKSRCLRVRSFFISRQSQV